jgi:hypothetical protein
MGENTLGVGSASDWISRCPKPKKSATVWGCAKVPPKEEDLEECANTLEEHQHAFIMPPQFGGSNVYCCFAVEFFCRNS